MKKQSTAMLFRPDFIFGRALKLLMEFKIIIFEFHSLKFFKTE